jgi:hypothetical protein
MDDAQPMKDFDTLRAELKQLPAEVGYILGWAANMLAVLIVIGSAILYVGLSQQPLFALGGCVVAFVVFLTGRALRYILAARG